MQLLYTSKSTKRTGNLEELFFDQEHPKLNQIDKEKCEGLLTEKECLEAVKSMELGKSPGTDGLPAEFYKVFLKDMSPFLISSLNRSYQNGKLAITQRRGVISLIPKKDKALNELKNWRPKTLPKCEYKIASKAIASFIKHVFGSHRVRSDWLFERPFYCRKHLLNQQCCFIHTLKRYSWITPLRRF